MEGTTAVEILIVEVQLKVSEKKIFCSFFHHSPSISVLFWVESLASYEKRTNTHNSLSPVPVFYLLSFCVLLHLFFCLHFLIFSPFHSFPYYIFFHLSSFFPFSLLVTVFPSLSLLYLLFISFSLSNFSPYFSLLIFICLSSPFHIISSFISLSFSIFSPYLCLFSPFFSLLNTFYHSFWYFRLYLPHSLYYQSFSLSFLFFHLSSFSIPLSFLLFSSIFSAIYYLFFLTSFSLFSPYLTFLSLSLYLFISLSLYPLFICIFFLLRSSLLFFPSFNSSFLLYVCKSVCFLFYLAQIFSVFPFYFSLFANLFPLSLFLLSFSFHFSFFSYFFFLSFSRLFIPF